MITKRLSFFIALITVYCLTMRAQGTIYEGTVGKYGIVVCLENHADGELTGWCYYTSKGASNKIVIKGNQDGYSYEFSEIDHGEAVSLFALKLNDTNGVLSGTHYNVNTGNELYVYLSPKNNIQEEENYRSSRKAESAQKQSRQRYKANDLFQSELFRNSPFKINRIGVVGEY